MILDKLIIILLISFSSISYLSLQKASRVDDALITINKEAYGKISISGDSAVLDTLLKTDGAIMAVIERGEGGVKVIYSSCPDKICLHAGKIARSGEKIVCVPNQLVISIGKEESGYDAVSE